MKMQQELKTSKNEIEHKIENFIKSHNIKSELKKVPKASMRDVESLEKTKLDKGAFNLFMEKFDRIEGKVINLVHAYESGAFNTGAGEESPA